MERLYVELNKCLLEGFLGGWRSESGVEGQCQESVSGIGISFAGQYQVLGQFSGVRSGSGSVFMGQCQGSVSGVKVVFGVQCQGSGSVLRGWVRGGSQFLEVRVKG